MPNSYRFLGCKLPNVSVTDGESQNYGTILPFLMLWEEAEWVLPEIQSALQKLIDTKVAL